MNFKWGLIGHTGRDVENSATESNLGYGGPAQEGSEKTISKCPRDCSCDILLKNMNAFCSCPKNLSETKLNFIAMALAQGTFRLPSKENIQSVQFEEKRSARKCRGAKFSAKETESSKKNLT